MKKKTSIATSLILLLLVFISCEQEDQIDTIKSIQSESRKEGSNDPINILRDREEIEQLDCDEIIKLDLIADQQNYIGEIFLFKKEDYLIITYDLTDTDWWLKETHVYLGDIKQASFNNTGYPKTGHFPYNADHDLVKSFSFEIPLEDLDDCFSVIAHASVILMVDGQQTQSETVFAQGGNKFTANQLGWYSNICQSECESAVDSIDDPLESSEEKNTTNENRSIEDSEGCMDAYAYSNTNDSQCFMPDFDDWGWTNTVISNDEHFTPGGIEYTYPLYASAFDCSPENSILIGEVIINVSGADNLLHATFTISLSKQELSITNVDIYAGSTSFPLDVKGNSTLFFDQFDISLNSMNEKIYTVTNLDWFDQTNFIVHVNVCPEEILD